MAFVVARRPAAAADPGQGPLDGPTLRQHHEAVLVAATNDLQAPGAGPRHGGGHLRPLVARIGHQSLDEGEQATGLPQHGLGAIAVLNVRRVDDDAQQQAERVDEDVPLAPERLLARVVAGRVERGAPFCAPFTHWASMMASVGLASRPACSRAPT